MAFGHFLTPYDMTVIAKVLCRAARKEPDMWKRKDIIRVITKLQRSMKSRRARAATRATKVKAA